MVQPSSPTEQTPVTGGTENQLVKNSVVALDPTGSLFEEISALIEEARTLVSRQVNSTLTATYWHIGHLINRDVLRSKRAEYADEIVGTLSPQLAARYGRGFDKSNLHRMVKFSQLFPSKAIVDTLCPQFSCR
jgi:hypothetical protein